MSIKLMASIFSANITDGEQSSASARKLVLLAMADYAAEDGSGVYPSRRTLEKKTALSSGALNYAIKSLLADKHIKKVGQRSKTAVIVYQLNIKKLLSEQFSEEAPPSTIELPEDTPSTIEDPPPQPLRDTPSTIEENPLVIRQVNPLEGSAKNAPPPPQPGEPYGVQDVINLVKRVTGRKPKTELHEYICDILGARPDEARLKMVFTAWIARDYNPDNIAGILEWYKMGIPGTRPGGKPVRDLPAIEITEGGFYA